MATTTKPKPLAGKKTIGPLSFDAPICILIAETLKHVPIGWFARWQMMSTLDVWMQESQILHFREFLIPIHYACERARKLGWSRADFQSCYLYVERQEKIILTGSR